jgi:hypothetical protein
MLADLRHAAWLAVAAKVPGSGKLVALARDRPAKMLIIPTVCLGTL